MNKGKIVLVSDIHIRLFNRLNEYKEQFERLYTHLEDEKPEYIVVGGDLFHSKTTLSPESISLSSSFLRRLSELCDTLIVIPGNHDLLVNNKDRLDSITPVIENLNINNIYYLTKSECYDIGDFIWCVWSQIEDNTRPDVNSSLEKHPNKKHIGLYHGVIQGLSTDIGFEFEDGTETNDFDGLHYTLCGDIHKRQVLYNTQGRPIIMVGSLIQQDQGESISNHGYCVVDTINDKFDFVNLETEYGFYTFKIKSYDDLINDKEVLTNM